MQFVNDDMDELFRKAAEEYPLDTRSMDWNKVAAALAEVPEAPVKRRDRRQLLWLFLLIPLPFVCRRYFSAPAEEPAGKFGASASEHPSRSHSANAAPSPAAGVRSRTTDAVLPPSAASQSPVNASKGGASEATSTAANDATRPDRTGTDRRQPGTPPDSGERNSQQEGAASSRPIPPVSERGRLRTRVKPGATGAQAVEDHTGRSALKKKPTDPVVASDENSSAAMPERTMVFPLLPPDRTKWTSPSAQERRLVQRPPARIQPQQPKKFYAGLMLGADLTTIRMQKVEDAGHSYGILLGYRFGHKWSLESGAYLDEKSYFSDGAHLGNKSIYMPPNARITDVRGVCRMIEIPINLRYTLSEGRKRSFFLTTGISSYLMKKEDYAYDYYYYQTNYTHTYRKTYRNESRNLFSLINFSGGYLRKLGAVGDLRIEPYLQLPIGKMGYGKLPLTSAGLQVGLTRTLF